MRLNHDCIRDILLFVEENTDDIKESVSSDELLESLPYDKNTLFYHIRRMDDANLFDDVDYFGDGIGLVSNLSWNGHCYIDNIRDLTIWEKVKSSANKLVSVSLPILIEKAAEIAFKSF